MYIEFAAVYLYLFIIVSCKQNYNNNQRKQYGMT